MNGYFMHFSGDTPVFKPVVASLQYRTLESTDRNWDGLYCYMLYDPAPSAGGRVEAREGVVVADDGVPKPVSDQRAGGFALTDEERGRTFEFQRPLGRYGAKEKEKEMELISKCEPLPESRRVMAGFVIREVAPKFQEAMSKQTGFVLGRNENTDLVSIQYVNSQRGCLESRIITLTWDRVLSDSETGCDLADFVGEHLQEMSRREAEKREAMRRREEEWGKLTPKQRQAKIREGDREDACWGAGKNKRR